MKHYLISFLVLLVILAIGCDGEKIVDTRLEQPPDDIIMPLAIGNQWSGIFKYSDPVNTGDTIYDTITASISIAVVKNNVYWFGIYSNSTWDNAPAYYLANRANGLWRIPANLYANDEPHLYAKYPAQVGDSFLTVGDIYSTVISIDTLVHTCISCPKIIYKYQLNYDTLDGSPEFTYYYSPGFGEIKWESHTPSLIDSYFGWEMSVFRSVYKY